MSKPLFPQKLYVAAVEDEDHSEGGWFSAETKLEDIEKENLGSVAEYQLVNTGSVEVPKRKFKPYFPQKKSGAHRA